MPAEPGGMNETGPVSGTYSTPLRRWSSRCESLLTAFELQGSSQRHGSGVNNLAVQNSRRARPVLTRLQASAAAVCVACLERRRCGGKACVLVDSCCVAVSGVVRCAPARRASTDVGPHGVATIRHPSPARATMRASAPSRLSRAAGARRGGAAALKKQRRPQRRGPLPRQEQPTQTLSRFSRSSNPNQASFCSRVSECACMPTKNDAYAARAGVDGSLDASAFLDQLSLRDASRYPLTTHELVTCARISDVTGLSLPPIVAGQLHELLQDGTAVCARPAAQAFLAAYGGSFLAILEASILSSCSSSRLAPPPRGPPRAPRVTHETCMYRASTITSKKEMYTPSA
jgi:hypothetical protein